MEWAEVGRSIVGNGVPMLGALLGGSTGEKLGSVVAGLLGCPNTADDVNSAISSNPEALLTLRKYEMDNVVQLQQLQLQELQAQLADVSNARDREKEIVKATGHVDYNLYVLAWIVVLGYFGLVWFMMRTALPDGNIGPINQLFGAMSAGFGMVLAYFFGATYKGVVGQTPSVPK